MLSQITELWRLWSLRDELVDLAQTQQITHAVLVDFPLMNVLLARRLHNLGIHVTYIAPPEMWLWGTWGINHWL